MVKHFGLSVKFKWGPHARFLLLPKKSRRGNPNGRRRRGMPPVGYAQWLARRPPSDAGRRRPSPNPLRLGQLLPALADHLHGGARPESTKMEARWLGPIENIVLVVSEDHPWLPSAPRVLFLPWKSILRRQLLAGAILVAAAMVLEAGACGLRQHRAEHPHRVCLDLSPPARRIRSGA
jgi:hypothetical protein